MTSRSLGYSSTAEICVIKSFSDAVVPHNVAIHGVRDTSLTHPQPWGLKPNPSSQNFPVVRQLMKAVYWLPACTAVKETLQILCGLLTGC